MNDVEFVTLDQAMPAVVEPTPAAPAPVATAQPAAIGSESRPPTEEEFAYGVAGLPPASDLAATVEPPSKPRKVVRFVEAEREKVVPLEHPVECEGIVYDRIVVRRLNVTDFQAYFSKPEGERGRFPCLFDIRGDAVPDEVVDALSLDDSNEVGDAYQHFLPASFRADPAR